MICQRIDSGSVANDGMPLLTSPLVMYQNSSPSLVCRIVAERSAGTLPPPSPLAP